MKAFGYSLIAIGILVALIFSMEYYIDSDRDIRGNDGGGYDVVVIDSCEYLVRQSGYSGYMAHKGNCRFCAARTRQSFTHANHDKIPLVK